MDLIEVSNNVNRHPWELSRTKCILSQLKKIGIHGSVLDIGCGDSYFDRCLIKEEPGLEVYGVDIYLEEEFHDGNLHAVNSLDHLPERKFDFIIMMDVLEHIKDDKGYLEDIVANRLADDGILFITVPALMSLYSLHDRELRHFRRYEHSRLKEVTDSAGLEEIRWSYFYFSLIIGRLLTKNKTENLSSWQRPADDKMTKLVSGILNADFAVLNTLSAARIHIPGLSLMSVCRKAKRADT